MGVANDRGRAAEALAAAYLELIGLKVLERNIRLADVEVDLLVADGATRIVVEVKYRRRGDFGGAALAVDRGKQERLRRAALALHQKGAAWVRVDVLAVELVEDGATLRHYRDAVRG